MSLPEFLFESVTADIRQQMEGVLALTEQLSRQPLTAESNACVTGVAEAAAGVRRLIECAVDLAAVTPQAVTFRPAPLSLRTAMDQVQDRWRTRATESGVTLLVSYDGPPEAAAQIDAARLMQVFDGLIGEALAAAPRGAVEASLRAEPVAGALQLEGRVRGGAALLPPAQGLEDRVRALAAHFGLEVALGALLAQRIVAGLEGVLQPQHHPGGAEMLFRLTVPAVRAAVATPARPARPAHVLVVDDNATNRMVAQALCEMHGCTCETANDGREAVETVRTGRFDLILMDIRMPVMDGITATLAIRAMSGRAALTPIVALTANADREDAVAYRAAGMDGVIEKPMKPAELLEALRKAQPADAPAAA
jgi:CheY-like chemotaxis protein